MDGGNPSVDEEYGEVVATSHETSRTSQTTSLSPPRPPPPSVDNRRSHWSTYDPYNPAAATAPPATRKSTNLLDEEEEEGQSRSATPDHELEAFLEMEELGGGSPPPKAQQPKHTPGTPPNYEPITTSSGLLLTHRRTTPAAARNDRQSLKPNEHHMSSLPRNLHREGLEVEGAHYYRSHPSSPQNPWLLLRRRASLVWIWLALSGLIFMLGTAILWHHVSAADLEESGTSNRGVTPDEQLEEQQDYSNRIVLLPMEMPAYDPPQQQQQQVYHQAPPPDQPYYVPQGEYPRRRLSEWQEAFDAWAQRHGKTYATEEERQHRLQVYMDNHQRTAAKNAKHGPCQLTQKPVFGNSNHFQDLTREEFTAQFLNAQRKERKLTSPLNAGTLGPHVSTSRHADVHHRIVQQQQQKRHYRPRSQKTYNCKWYNISCNLRYVIERYFYGFFGVGRTMEPAYDEDSYPNSVDWRDIGAVTDVRSQNNCGACWAITAVETLESAVFLATGDLITLSETEVILCSEDCEMCSGGWPEEAFEYIMANGGLPLQDDLSYNGEYLLKITSVLAGESDELSNSDINAYKQKVCPSGGGGGSNDSKDSKDESSYSYTDDAAPYSFTRYGDILEGYGYATDPCLCYTDGSGCDCDSQDENTAVRNLATYGPAVVCVDASLWQDYEGGVITSASGCSAGYLDVNHCVQVVGYAFSESSGNGGQSGDSNSGDNENSQDSRDRNLGSGDGEGGSYEGYWIVRNEWSEYWGMNGYARVEMGENTCGLLNDMLQVYTND